MPTLPVRAAAYTRTGILRRFLELLADAPPARVDAAFAENRMGLKGGDVRAFLQCLRVLGLVDPYGALTDRARRTRAQTLRAAAMREALQEAYPELWQRWAAREGMPREEVEDFFKLDYGLSTSTAGPAAKLFTDLMREFGQAPAAAPAESDARVRGAKPARSWGGDPPAPKSPALASPPPAQPTDEPPPRDVRVAALEAVKSSLHIDINADWDSAKIDLVFDRMERLVDRILGG
jgi:hypothetical protein